MSSACRRPLARASSLAVAVVALVGLLFTNAGAADVAADELVITTQHFRFEYTPDDEGFARRLSSVAEAVRREVTYFIGYDFKALTRVVIAPDPATYAQVQPRARVPEWSVGAAFVGDNLIVLLSERAARKENARFDPLVTFRHELSHIVLGKALAPNDPPRWLDEGIAQFQSEPWTAAKTWRLTLASLSGRTQPISHWMVRWPRKAEPAHVAYLESHAFVDYLYRQGAVSGIVTRMREGANAPMAIEGALGMSLGDLDEEFRHFMERNFTWVHILANTDLAWGMATLVFLVVMVLSYFRTRKKRRLLELEDELEDLQKRPRRRPRGSRRHEDDLDDYLDGGGFWN